MNTKLFLIAVAIVAAFGFAVVIGPAGIATPAVAQNVTGDNATTTTAGNMTVAGNATGSNWTK